MEKHTELILEILADKIEQLENEILLLELENEKLRRENTALRADVHRENNP